MDQGHVGDQLIPNIAIDPIEGVIIKRPLLPGIREDGQRPDVAIDVINDLISHEQTGAVTLDGVRDVHSVERTTWMVLTPEAHGLEKLMCTLLDSLLLHGCPLS